MKMEYNIYICIALAFEATKRSTLVHSSNQSPIKLIDFPYICTTDTIRVPELSNQKKNLLV